MKALRQEEAWDPKPTGSVTGACGEWVEQGEGWASPSTAGV